MSVVLYVFKVAGHPIVKIGHSRSWQSRLVQVEILCRSTLEPLLALPVDSHHDEILAHRRFETDRISGEWFHLTPQIEEWIASFAQPRPVSPKRARRLSRFRLPPEGPSTVHPGRVRRIVSLTPMAAAKLETIPARKRWAWLSDLIEPESSALVPCPVRVTREAAAIARERGSAWVSDTLARAAR